LFGVLCALDPDPKDLTEEAWETFKLMGNLIAFELEADEKQQEREGVLKLAEQSNEMRARFMSILGHDLRNPLSTIMMAATMLKRSELNQQQSAQILETILRTVKRMQFLIDDLLDTTRAVQGNEISIHKKSSDLRAICETVLEEFRLANPARKIEFEAPQSCSGEWDAARIAQVLSNLLSNALHYGNSDFPVIISLFEKDEAIILEVNNQGEIISESVQKNLFTPFWRGAGKNAVSSNSSGLGLGLYIVKLIAEAHDGIVEVKSNLETGTSFQVIFPKKKVEPSKSNK
jgi:sigma-B regulation protein RsbU (phosphoserine phosphatase)